MITRHLWEDWFEQVPEIIISHLNSTLKLLGYLYDIDFLYCVSLYVKTSTLNNSLHLKLLGCSWCNHHGDFTFKAASFTFQAKILHDTLNSAPIMCLKLLSKLECDKDLMTIPKDLSHATKCAN